MILEHLCVLLLLLVVLLEHIFFKIQALSTKFPIQRLYPLFGWCAKYCCRHNAPDLTAKELIQIFVGCYLYQNHRTQNVEEHSVETPDGFYLGLQRIIISPAFECDQTVSLFKKTPVLLMHGLMMSSECFLTGSHVSLVPFLVKKGFDVWLGNYRGNKYSSFHRDFTREDVRYWNFSLDELAHLDIPCTVKYILNTTKANSLGYIGFSTGCAIMFAALAGHSELNKKIRFFIALSPAWKLQSLHTVSNKFPLFSPLLVMSPNLFFLCFGRKQMLQSTSFWRKILSSRMFNSILDLALWLLFSWKIHPVDPQVKTMFYSHLYSATSTHMVAHWLQILQSQAFKSYKWKQFSAFQNTENPHYSLKKITTHISLIYGTEDNLIDIHYLRHELAYHSCWSLPNYQHLDCLVCLDIEEKLFPIISYLLDYVYCCTESANNRKFCHGSCGS